MSSCRLHHSDIGRACTIIGDLLSTLEQGSPGADDSDVRNLRDGLSAMQGITLSNLVDVRLAHQRTLSSAYAFLAASSSSPSSEDDEFDDDEMEAQDADSAALRYGIAANRNRLPTPEPTSGSEACHRPSSGFSTSSASGLDLLEKLRGIEMADEGTCGGAEGARPALPLVQARAGGGRRRDPLGSLDSSTSSVEPPPFLSSRRASRLDQAACKPPSRPASSAAGPLRAVHAGPASGDGARDGSLTRKLAANEIRDSLGDLDATTRVAGGCVERAPASPGLADSLVFMRRKSSLSEVEQAISNRRRRTVTLCLLLGAELGLEAMGSAHHGLFVSDVVQRSRADAAGLRAGDQLLSVNGRSLVGVASSEFARLVQERDTDQMLLIVQQNRAGMEEFYRAVELGYSED